MKTKYFKCMDGLKSMGCEFLRPSNSLQDVAFPSLEVLVFKDMKSWEEWTTSGGDKAGLFPILREMSIINCPKLDVTEMELIPSLQVLLVEGCSLAVLKTMIGVSSSITRLTMKDIKGLTQLHGEVFDHLKAVEYLSISMCDELMYLWESEVEAYAILVNLKRLALSECKNLVKLGEKEANLMISVESFREVSIKDCPRLESIEELTICGCDNLEVNWLLMPSLESLRILSVPNLRLFPVGCLVHLTSLKIGYCHNIESIPNNGYGFLQCLCLRELTIIGCKNLKSFPHEQLQSLTYLKTMDIIFCPSLNESFPCGLWPPNLSFLRIGGLKKPISEWGLQNFPTSLDRLHLYGGENDSCVVSFAKAEEEDMINGSSSSSSSFLLPSSLTYLSISGFMDLESVSDGLQHLTSLQHLHISSCPKLRALPETLLPSLSSLDVSNYCSSEELRKKCRRSGKGKYWPIISQIPHLELHLKYEQFCLRHHSKIPA